MIPIPIKCPKCKKPLINSFCFINKNREEAIYKYCCSNIDHNFSCIINPDETINTITLSINNYGIFVVFKFFSKTITITKDKIHYLELPWFEPNIYDYKNLVKKLKTYVVLL